MTVRFLTGGLVFLLLFFSPVRDVRAAVLPIEEKCADKALNAITRREGAKKEDQEDTETNIESLIDEVLEGAGISFDEIQESLDNSSLKGSISFEDILKKIWAGDTEDVFQDLSNLVKDTFLAEIEQNRKNFVQIILLAVFSAMFANLAAGFFSSTLQETGFFAAYLAMTGIILNSFFLMVSITEEALSQVFDFMNVFLPAFAISITMVSGSASSIGIYEITFFLVKACQWALKSIVIPLIEAYMIVEIINCISETDKFSYFSHLIKKGTDQLLKWSTGIILGLNLIQNMILPAVDSVKSTIWQKGLSAIPGAGAVISALTGSLLGASVLIKNSIGVGCLVILLLLCAIPVIKLLLFMFSFYLCSAFLQPVSDKRLMGLLFAAGESAKLFLQALVACFTLFFITIALAAISTNMRYYAG